MPTLKQRRAIFLDRDGTVNVDTGYVARMDDVQLLPRAAQGAKQLQDAGFALFVVSNQSGIARGIFTEAQAQAIDNRVLQLLGEQDVRIEATYRCPHFEGGSVARYARACDCRKPKPGMILQAAREHNIDLAASWTIGDAERDVQAGLAAGTKGILIADDQAAKESPSDVAVARDLVEAARHILEH